MKKKDEHLVTGFVLVRIPAACETAASWSYYGPIQTHYGLTYYGGIDRMRWHDIGNVYYAGDLPEDLRHEYEVIQNNSDILKIAVSKNYDVTHKMLDYVNRSHPTNEIVAIQSSLLVNDVELEVGAFESAGFDVLSYGYWSLLNEGLFHVPSAFVGWDQYLNSNGLFISPDMVDEYVDVYRASAHAGEVEPLPMQRSSKEVGIGPGFPYALEIRRIRK